MKYRKLRIAWSVAWGVVCLLLIALWVRSFWCNDSITRFTPSFQGIASEYGDLVFMDTDTFRATDESWRFATEPIGDDLKYRGWWAGLRISHWFPMTLFAAIAALPWLPRRFSLRTLLIAMTLVAVLLGAIAVSMR